MKVRKIDISDIKLSRFKCKREVKSERVAEMVESIERFDLIQPIVVRVLEKGGYELLAGEHRLKAAKKLKWKKISAKIEKVNKLEGELIGLEENIRRWEPSSAEWSEILVRWKELYEKKHKKNKAVRLIKSATTRKKKEKQQISPKCRKLSVTVQDETEIRDRGEKERRFTEVAAEKAGVSERNIQRAISRTTKIDPKVKKAWKEKKITSAQVDVLASVSREKQLEVLPKIKGKTRRETKELVRVIDVNPRSKYNQKQKNKKADPQVLIKRLARYMKETNPLCEQLNNKLSAILAIMNDLDGDVQMGGIKMFQISFELGTTYDFIGRVIKNLKGIKDEEQKGKN